MGFLTVLIYIILSFIVGGLLIGLSVNLIVLDQLVSYVQKEILANWSLNLIVGLSGLIIILLCLRYLQSFFRRSRRNKSIIFESPEGNVSITLFALEDMVKRMLEEQTEVSNIKPKVFLKRQTIEVITRGVLAAEVNLVDFTKEIQEKIKEKMHILLGEDKEVKVSLIIRKVSLGARKEVPEEPEPEIPFRNYE